MSIFAYPSPLLLQISPPPLLILTVKRNETIFLDVSPPPPHRPLSPLTATRPLAAPRPPQLPTVSNKPRHNHAEMEEYFIEFRKPGEEEWSEGPKVKAAKFPNGAVSELTTNSKYEFRVSLTLFQFLLSQKLR